jgi:guanosine-3',5'-bis(diphosphate) 3'-pyrophosphohydrolase
VVTNKLPNDPFFGIVTGYCYAGMDIEKEKILAEVTRFAEAAHGDQQRKYSRNPYIEHPVRVMRLCSEYTADIAVLSAALLHDVLEDTDVPGHKMKEFLLQTMTEPDATRTYRMVQELTDVYVKADYPEWNRRKRKAMEIERMKATSADSQTVKYADIIDNCMDIVKHDKDFARVFLRECRELLKVLDKGNKELYQRALDTISRSTSELETAREHEIADPTQR